MSYRIQVARYQAQASLLGIPYHVADALRRYAQRLHTISEQECNGTLWRVEGCRKRIDAVAASVGGTVEYQGDPRGWPVTLRINGAELSPPVRS